MTNINISVPKEPNADMMRAAINEEGNIKND